MRHSTKKPTKAEQARFDKMGDMGICVCCYQLGIKGWQPIERHHLLSGNKRIGHMATVSLCPWHHRGIKDPNISGADEYYWQIGPSLAYGSKPFHAEFGSDAELLAMQNEMLHG